MSSIDCKTPRNKLLIQAHPKSGFESYLEYAAEHGLGLEVTDFAFGDVLDGSWREILDRRRSALAGFENTISFHGVFMEITVHSHDRKISEVSRARVKHNLDIASELGAEFIVFHSNFIPLIKEESYRRNWIERNAEFWLEMTRTYDATILIENLWEPSPSVLREFLDLTNSVRIGVLLDVGHVNVFSEASIGDWISTVGRNVGYMHVHDNHGQRDEHLVPGKGTIDWHSLSEAIKKLNINPGVLFEVDSLPDSIAALDFFHENVLYPLDR